MNCNQQQRIAAKAVDVIINLRLQRRVCDHILYGGQANDTLWGGAGNDFFELTRGANVGVDRVKDYTDGADKFLLSNRFGLGSLNFSDLSFTQKGDNAQINIARNNQLLAILENTNVAQLDSNDFVTV